jgi:hypothetical protein
MINGKPPTIFQQLDDDVLDTSSTNIPASSGSLLTVVESLAAQSSGILIFSELDANVGFYSDGNLKAIIPNGWTDYLGVQLSVGSMISLRNMDNTAVNNGKLVIQFTN